MRRTPLRSTPLKSSSSVNVATPVLQLPAKLQLGAQLDAVDKENAPLELGLSPQCTPRTSTLNQLDQLQANGGTIDLTPSGVAPSTMCPEERSTIRLLISSLTHTGLLQLSALSPYGGKG